MKNTDLTVFQKEEFGSVRVVTLDGEPWFVAADVCRALELERTNRALSRLDDDEKGAHLVSTPGGRQMMSIISESGLYALVLGSRKPEAKAFKRWITHEVIPAIRKRGVYITDEKLKLLAEKPEMLDVLIQALYILAAENIQHDEEHKTLLPKAEYYDAFVEPGDCTNIRTTAKELQVPERAFCRFLLEARFLYRCPAGNLMPYNKPGNEGLFIVRDYVKNGHKGAYTLITPKGKNLFRLLSVRPDEAIA